MRRYAVIVALALVAVLALRRLRELPGKAVGAVHDHDVAELFSSPTYEKAKPTPSKSAKMVCQKEVARRDRVERSASQRRGSRRPPGTRPQHLYSCTYVYPEREDRAVGEGDVERDGDHRVLQQHREEVTAPIQSLIGLGQGAWVLKNSDVVVRKDYKVLLVNVEGIPAQFSPLMKSSDAAINIASVIMGCWKGK